MQTDYIIVGQGISGTFLSWEMQRAGLSFIVIDEQKHNTATKVASGVINPVTGRRIVKTWMIEDLMPFAWNVYTAIGNDLGVNCIEQKNIIDFFPTVQMKLAFEERYKKDQQFLSLPKDENDWLDKVNYDFGYGVIDLCYWIDLQRLLPAQRANLAAKNQLRDEHFDITQLAVSDDGIAYKDITAKKIIFCDGANGFDNPYFKNLPYGANKGEALLVEIKDLPAENILKKGYSLVPWKENIFWLGSTYLWEFENADPSPGYYQFAKNWLAHTLKMPFEVLDHIAAIRPATLERRPFVGFHPMHPTVGILNGMGTKGCSLAPFFAKQLVESIVNGTAVMPEASVLRFAKVLARNL